MWDSSLYEFIVYFGCIQYVCVRHCGFLFFVELTHIFLCSIESSFCRNWTFYIKCWLICMICMIPILYMLYVLARRDALNIEVCTPYWIVYSMDSCVYVVCTPYWIMYSQERILKCVLTGFICTCVHLYSVWMLYCVHPMNCVPTGFICTIPIPFHF